VFIAPSGSAVVVTESAGLITMLRSFVFVCGVVEESVAAMVKFAVPDAVGVPSMTPVVPCRVRPAGSVPAVTLHETGCVPPLDCSVVAGYALFIVPPGSDVVVIVNGGGAITMLSAFVAVSAGVVESLTRTVKSAVPAAVGVPSITPVALCKVRPAGSAPAITVHAAYGGVPPVAVSVAA